MQQRGISGRMIRKWSFSVAATGISSLEGNTWICVCGVRWSIVLARLLSKQHVPTIRVSDVCRWVHVALRIQVRDACVLYSSLHARI